ncbi:glyoxylase-like metal-dependent hydrolase (beta-lactamase superfamily II) [Pseudomonas sp. BIGb0408]|uniref:Glyoxylase-like metal-dependent hydrolase (Beta-lactamase superfamily II) n=1 Tax=Phytopseudomonas flavescens TaxID=29435 RepID=A0A7Y9XLF1_9GAMM|nr:MULTISPECIES: MBL fold metallo-hydrolase [Pseudomonas]MCW2293160.1 glyoxylase-like metal-dependent hydrolase (beta-lactamase superfamily II) [Pseudomonas sp. BIGb0408]NYH72269.1 glyoxylase-like metal-dependent hydrolase (beta-lactamase superfamily II) [Pseudomonas flavescens]
MGTLILPQRLKTLGVVAFMAVASQAAFAAPADQHQQAAGFYRQMVGNTTVTAVYDGYIDLNPKHLAGMPQEKIQEHMLHEYQKAAPFVQTAVNAFLVDDGKQLVLIDSGSSDCFGPTMGRMVDNIRAAGYRPEEVDAVLLTHMHPDHACGVTLPSGKRAFTNATVWAAAQDANYWLDVMQEGSLPEEQRPFFKMARDAISPYSDVGKFKTFNEGDSISPGIQVVPSNGHTPGHTSYLLSSGDEKLLLWGDIVHVHAVQLPHPEVTIAVDVDPKAAVASRTRLFAKAARERWLVAAAHLPFPGIGHLRKEEKGYSWVPVEYRNPVNSER